MTLAPRALCVVICLAASACIGGPTSEWPNSEHDDESPNTPPAGGGAADAGTLSPGRIDAGGSGSVADGRDPCEPSIDGGADAGVGDPNDPSNPHARHQNEATAPDAGCR